MFRWYAYCAERWRPVALATVVLLSAAVLLEPRRDDVASFFKRVSRDISQNLTGVHAVDDALPEYTKDLGLDELKRMLVSASPGLRASAVRALAERNDYEIVPYLIKLMNNTKQSESDDKQETASLSQLAKVTVTRMIRRRIQQEPSNISFLIPYLNGAMSGSLLERKAYIEILGELREPLAVPALSAIADKDAVPEMQEAARIALAKIDADEIVSSRYASQRAHQLRVVVILCVFALILLGAGVVSTARRGEMRFVLLSLVPFLVCVGLAGAVAMDFYRGTLTPETVDKSIAEGNVMSLRTMIYQERPEFPGDSFVAHRLVKIGDANTIHSLGRMTTIEPDDFQFSQALAEKQRQWVLSRLVASRLGTPALNKLTYNSDPAVKLALVIALDGLMVRNESIKGILTILTGDSNGPVGQKASETLTRIANRPVWPDFQLPGPRSDLLEGPPRNL